jgi:hypothetical protein
MSYAMRAAFSTYSGYTGRGSSSTSCRGSIRRRRSRPAVGDPLAAVLRREHQRDRAVADRRDVEPLHRPRERLRREHVLHGDLRLPEQRARVVGRVPLVLDGDLAMSRFSSPYAFM